MIIIQPHFKRVCLEVFKKKKTKQKKTYVQLLKHDDEQILIAIGHLSDSCDQIK